MERIWTVTLLCGGLAFAAAPAPAQPVAVSVRDLLAAHNTARARVGVPPLTWSSQLESMARKWAQTLLTTGTFRHSPPSEYGENLYEVRGDTSSPAQVVGVWVAEAKDYNLETNTCRAGAMCGHYTQVVWKGTRQVGCAVIRGNGREIWVCNYSPPGNWVGQKPF